MFIHYQTRGLILKKEDRGDFDRIFIIFTEQYGKLELLAKAERKIKSKLRAGLELFYLSELEFIQGKAQKILTEAILENNFKNLRKNIFALRASYKIAQVSDSLLREAEKDEGIWDLLTDIFSKLDQGDTKKTMPVLAYYYFLWNFFQLLGYGLDFFACSECQNKLAPERIFFDAKRDGLICGSCRKNPASGTDVSDKIIKIIRIFLKKDWKLLQKIKIGRADLKELKIFSDYYLDQIFAKIA